MSGSTALLTDRYELTMLAGALHSGVAERPAVFEVFTRRLPAGRGYGVVAGVDRLVDALGRFAFGPDELAWLADAGVADGRTLDWLAGYRFSGDITAYPDGELHGAVSPVLTVEAPFGEAVLLETLVLSILNHDAAVAAAGARIAAAAGERPVIEMGSRRTDPEAAVAAARIAHLVGFSATSNLEAGRRFGVPTTGTAAHAFTLAHPSEREAFRAQVETQGDGTTLLVDTYDVEAGIAAAVEVAGDRLGAIRIDSGDLRAEAVAARAQLDRLGATSTRIVVTGDLDDAGIAALAAAPVDGYGVGTSYVTGLGHPTAGFVYKLVAIADERGGMRPVAKRSPGKASVGSRKWAWRALLDELPEHHEGPEVRRGGPVLADIVTTTPERPGGARPLQEVVVAGGEPTARPTLAEARAAHLAARAELAPEAVLVTVRR